MPLLESFIQFASSFVFIMKGEGVGEGRIGVISFVIVVFLLRKTGQRIHPRHKIHWTMKISRNNSSFNK